jgi:hypothetical protein
LFNSFLNLAGSIFSLLLLPCFTSLTLFYPAYFF